jgi:hypothetical protein
MTIGRHGSVPTRPGNAKSAQMTFSPRARTFSNTCVFAVVCSSRRSVVSRSVVIGALPAPSLHQNELRASTACTLSKHVIFMFFCESSAFRRDWCSSGHLLEGLRPHGSPKWLPHAPFKAMQNNSAYRGDWRSPGATITPKWVSGLDCVHISNNVCLRICL